MYDKLAYSIVWLVVLLYGLGYVNTHPQMGGSTLAYWLLVVAILIQIGVIMYHASDVHSRRRMWQKMQGEPACCPHGCMDWDDCPDCRH